MAPSGMAGRRSDRYGREWQNSLFEGSPSFGGCSRRVVVHGRIVRGERLLPGLNARIRDVRKGPDGLLYLLTDERDGRLLRVVPLR